jgi:rubrerythrin
MGDEMPQRANVILRWMEKKNIELTDKNNEFKELNENHANAERVHNIEYAKKLTTLRSTGESITLAKELVKGNEFIAELFFKMRVAEGVKWACRERMKDIRTSIDVLRSELSYIKAEMEVL